MFGRLGTTELILILGIALVVFGPSKLPEIGKAFGKGIKEFKQHSNKSIQNDESEK
ncbi:twin-arginine translocase TatA/TatE family subunit [Alkaliphilus transvaalensis]|uniref:twin-arginine translocase TatA/TatE family subunit n=1 Tax=Alkaliphilus transvaalensis TaxID=114628 RepID=UPI00047AB94F|nr:twin-arginine translocase TatA/TatE family subunit [Alkaliphilus transvaalensis]